MPSRSSHISDSNNLSHSGSVFNWLLLLICFLLISLFYAGGLTVRAILQTMDDHNVDSFISLSSPQMGQYGGI